MTPDRVADYQSFFDHDAFMDNPMWADCYCMFYRFSGTNEEWEHRTAKEVALRLGARAGERRHERRQPGRRARMEQVRRAHGRRGIALHPPRLVPGTRRVRLVPRERKGEAELQPDERAVRIALREDSQPPHGAGRPRPQRVAHVAGHLGRSGRVGDEGRRLARRLVHVRARRHGDADRDRSRSDSRGPDDQPDTEPRAHPRRP